ncbi:hypothetical protein ABTJ92_20430, partial [Acinetobacter baumannii]
DDAVDGAVAARAGDRRGGAGSGCRVWGGSTCGRVRATGRGCGGCGRVTGGVSCGFGGGVSSAGNGISATAGMSKTTGGGSG